MRGRRPEELGRLITIFRPRHPLGWLWLTALPVPFAVWAAVPDGTVIRERHRVPRGELRAAPPEERQNPLLPQTVLFRGLESTAARWLAKGSLSWADAGASVIEMAGSRAETRAQTAPWTLSVRDPESAREQLTQVITASHRRYPYQRPVGPD